MNQGPRQAVKATDHQARNIAAVVPAPYQVQFLTLVVSCATGYLIMHTRDHQAVGVAVRPASSFLALEAGLGSRAVRSSSAVDVYEGERKHDTLLYVARRLVTTSRRF